MKKFITVLATVVMMAAMSITAFAATKGWYQDENAKWHYADADENDVCDEWKGGYYLNEDGILVTDSIFEYDGDYYCVGSTGLKMTNVWALTYIDEDDDEKSWMWFKANGKAVKEGWQTISGVKFLFDEWAMQTGFIDDNNLVIDMDDDVAWTLATYYCENNGMVKGWLKVMDTDGEDKWIYFGVDGKKVTGKKVIDGITYHFDETTGAMKDTWFASPSDLKFANADGSVVKNGWVYVEASGSDCGESNWFYFKNGVMAQGSIMKINGKYYGFAEDGKMLTGFVMVDLASRTTCDNHVSASEDIDDVRVWQNSALACRNRHYMYFAESSDPMLQGAAATEKTTIKMAGGEYTFNFNKFGFATLSTDSVPERLFEEVVKNYYYVGGVLQADADAEFKYRWITLNQKEYVVNNLTGRAYTSGTFTDSENNYRYRLKDGNIELSIRDMDGKWGDWFTPLHLGSPE